MHCSRKETQNMRKLPFLCGFALAVLVQPALASTGLEKLEEGLTVARACGADARELCKGVRPGEGRIAACMKQNMQKLSPDCAEHLLMAKALDQGPAKVH